MKLLRTFFHFTRIFWIISRLVLGLIFCYCAIFLLEGADTMDYFSAAFFILLGFTLLWSFIAGLFRGGAHKWIKIFGGSVLMLVALAMAYSTIDVFGMGDAVLILLLPLWFLMSGLFELFSLNSKKIVPSKIQSSDLPLNSEL